MREWDEVTDVVVVGSGAAGLAAALTSYESGLQPIVLERAANVAGSTALAGGGMWVPANRFMVAHGDHDSDELALAYLVRRSVTLGPPQAASGARRSFATSVRPSASSSQPGCAFAGRRGTRTTTRKHPGAPSPAGGLSRR